MLDNTKDIHEIQNGICVACGYKKECTHLYETKKDEEYHWKECKNCGEIVEKEIHNYVNGICKCGAEIKIQGGQVTECKHIERIWKSDENKHWQVCKECDEEISGTRNEHVYVDGKCKNCGVLDGTNSNDKLPNTGNTKVIIGISVLSICIAVGVIGIKKYKNI